MKYRIIYNGKVYKIQRRTWWSCWITLEPSMYRVPPVDWSKYVFETIEQAKERIEELKQYEKESKWEVVKS